jgi:hypothetical protein
MLNESFSLPLSKLSASFKMSLNNNLLIALIPLCIANPLPQSACFGIDKPDNGGVPLIW